jgi:hypothetical protein
VWRRSLRRCVDLGGQEDQVRLDLGRHHVREGFGTEQRRVAIEDEHVAVESLESPLGLRDGVAGPALLFL